MRKAAVIILLLMLFGMVQPLFAGNVLSYEPENYGGLAWAFRAIFGGVAGFFAGGIPGAVMGAGLMAVIDPRQGCAGCQDIGSPIVY